MSTSKVDPRARSKGVAERLPPLHPARQELVNISSLTSAVVARARVRALRTLCRRSGDAILVAQLDLLLARSSRHRDRPDIECEICGKAAERYLRTRENPAVCREHSSLLARTRDMRAIGVMLRDPSLEFLGALVNHASAIRLQLDDKSDPNALGVLWPRLLADHRSMLSIWRSCCEPYPDSTYTPEPADNYPITSSLWEMVSNSARARDAEASASNGRAGGRPRNQKQEQEIRRLAKHGLTQKEIAARLGTAQCQVSRVLRRVL